MDILVIKASDGSKWMALPVEILRKKGMDNGRIFYEHARLNMHHTTLYINYKMYLDLVALIKQSTGIDVRFKEHQGTINVKDIHNMGSYRSPKMVKLKGNIFYCNLAVGTHFIENGNTYRLVDGYTMGDANVTTMTRDLVVNGEPDESTRETVERPQYDKVKVVLGWDTLYPISWHV